MSDAGNDEAAWAAVDAYLADHLISKDEVLEAALRDSEAAGLPAIQVTALQGKMLQMFARMLGARRILEWARWAVTARSGWRARCLKADVW